MVLCSKQNLKIITIRCIINVWIRYMLIKWHNHNILINIYICIISKKYSSGRLHLVIQLCNLIKNLNSLITFTPTLFPPTFSIYDLYCNCYLKYVFVPEEMNIVHDTFCIVSIKWCYWILIPNTPKYICILFNFRYQNFLLNI